MLLSFRLERRGMKRNFIIALVIFSAISVSGSAAFYSISGLSKLFAGAWMEVIIMASSLEFSKLIIASVLQNYWSSLKTWIKTYLSVALVVLILITSVGIYGFLSSAYEKTSSSEKISQTEINILVGKKERYEEENKKITSELNGLNNSILELTKSSNSTSQSQKYDKNSKQVITNISQKTNSQVLNRISSLEDRSNTLSSRVDSNLDSISKLDILIIEKESQLTQGSDLGPLKYISGITNIPMDKIVNYLILIIIFVFDPLAISLVIVANFLIMRVESQKEGLTAESTKQETVKIADTDPRELAAELEDRGEGVDMAHEAIAEPRALNEDIGNSIILENSSGGAPRDRIDEAFEKLDRMNEKPGQPEDRKKKWEGH